MVEEITVSRVQMTRVMAMFHGTVSAHYDTHQTIESSTLKRVLDNALDAGMPAPLAWEPLSWPRARLAAEAERERQALSQVVEAASNTEARHVASEEQEDKEARNAAE